MINIRPVSDLRNKYPEIEDIVLNENEPVFLTKNGYGSMVVMSLEKYSKIMEDLKVDKAIEDNFGAIDIDKILEEAEEEKSNSNTKYYSHEELFTELRGIINGKNIVKEI